MTFPCCREALDAFHEDERCSHPGLLLHRYLYLPQGGDRAEAIRWLQNRAASAPTPEPYRQAYNRWKRLLSNRNDALYFTGETTGPLAVGLGNETVLEAGLTLSHTYGFPVIPGSALKGLCVRGLARWCEASGASNDDATELRKILFGTQDSAAYVLLHDAWYDPSSPARPLLPDTITVHHPKYYQNSRKEWPTDFDDPNPVPVLAVAPNVRFLFALEAPSEELRTLTRDLLQWSLQHLGIGGKTNAGYGSFHKFEQEATPTVWTSCLLKQERSDGEIQVTGNAQELTIRPGLARALRRRLDSAQQQALRTGTLRASIRVRPTPGGFDYLGIEEILPDPAAQRRALAREYRELLEWMATAEAELVKTRDLDDRYPGAREELVKEGFLLDLDDLMALSDEGKQILHELNETPGGAN